MSIFEIVVQYLYESIKFNKNINILYLHNN